MSGAFSNAFSDDFDNDPGAVTPGLIRARAMGIRTGVGVGMYHLALWALSLLLPVSYATDRAIQSHIVT